jgi:hypothetical protein
MMRWQETLTGYEFTLSCIWCEGEPVPGDYGRHRITYQCPATIGPFPVDEPNGPHEVDWPTRAARPIIRSLEKQGWGHGQCVYADHLCPEHNWKKTIR